MAAEEPYNRYGLVGNVIIAVDDTEIVNIDDAEATFETVSKQYGSTVIKFLNEDGKEKTLIFQ